MDTINAAVTVFAAFILIGGTIGYVMAPPEVQDVVTPQLQTPSGDTCKWESCAEPAPEDKEDDDADDDEREDRDSRSGKGGGKGRNKG